MKRIKKDPAEVYKEFQDDQSYKEGLNLFETVKRNNNFYHGRQWEGLNAPMLEKPVFNIIKPSINYMVSMLMTDDIGVSVDLQNTGESAQAEVIENILHKEIDNVFEQNNISYQNREALTSCAVDGDTVRHHYWDPTTKTGFAYTGSIKSERIDNTNIVFGNHSTNEIQTQPYIILAMKVLTSEVQEMAKANGIAEYESIRPDDEMQNYYNSDVQSDDTKYTTVLLKYWKENGKVHFLKCTQNALVQKETPTEMELYPISYFSWEKTKHCCHGTSPVTSAIPGNVFVNKIIALAMEHNKKNAFPKIIFDATKIKGWSNDVTKAIAVNGNPNDAIFSSFSSAPVNPQAIELANFTISQIKDSLGVSDAALGNVKPDNTSAIVALQRASSQPLELQRMDFYKFVEDSVRIIVDMMAAYYGIRMTEVKDPMGNVTSAMYDFSTLRSLNLNLTVEIGAATYWSELMQVNTLDNMLAQKLIDNIQYLELLPDGYIPGRDKIIQELAENQQQQMAQQPNTPMQPEQQGVAQELMQAAQMPQQMI